MLTIVLTLAILIVIMMAIREIRNFQRDRGMYRFRRLTLRLSMAGMLLFLLVSLFIGVKVFGLNEPLGIDPHAWLAFWACVVLLVGAIACLVIVDLTNVPEMVSSTNPNAGAEIAEIIAKYQKRDEDG